MIPNRLRRALPFLDWFQGYTPSAFRADLNAGLTVALVLIPQSMAYAQLAGLPPYYGLYAALLPPVVAALFGSSRRLATGPVAVVSIMTAAALEPLATAGSQAYITAAILLAFLVGTFQLLLGLFRLGLVVNLLSHPVIVGFTNGAALIIASSQFPKLLGIQVEQAPHYLQTIQRMAEAARTFIHWPSLGLGLLAMAIMILVKRISPRLPAVLIAVIITTLAGLLTGFEQTKNVSLSAIDNTELPVLVERLQRSLTHVDQAARAKRGLARRPSVTARKDKKLCARCHPRRELDATARPWPPSPSRPVPRENVLELHFMAGVLDEYISEERELAARLRQRIRSLRLVAVQEPGRGILYQSLEQAPRRSGITSPVWRIRVPAEGLDPQHLELIAGGLVIGDIPRGLPAFGLPRFDGRLLPRLLVPAMVITLLGFMEAISVAKAIAAQTGRRLDANQELIGQGLANIVGAMSASYPVSGSFSRSAVNFQAGAQTGLASLITSLTVLATLYFFTPLLYHLPQPVLAAIIIMAVTGLFNIRDIRHAWKVQPADGLIAVITFCATLLFAPHLDRGILLGVLLSVAVFFYRHARPVIAELSLWKDGHFRSARRLHLRTCPYIVVLRFDGPLFFANISYLEQAVLAKTRNRPQLRLIHFKCNGINEVDASGECALRLLVDRLHAAGYQVTFSGLKLQIMDIFRRSGLLEIIGTENIFPTLAQAMTDIWPRVHAPGLEKTCPLKTVLSRDESVVAWDKGREGKER